MAETNDGAKVAGPATKPQTAAEMEAGVRDAIADIDRKIADIREDITADEQSIRDLKVERRTFTRMLPRKRKAAATTEAAN